MNDNRLRRWPSGRFMAMALALPALGHFAAVSPLPAQQAASASPATAPKQGVVLQGVTVVDVTDGKLVPEQTVVVTGNRVQAIGPAGKVKVPAGVQVVDAKGKYLIPGLWEMHAHMRWEAPRFYPHFLAHGVTGVREMGQRFEHGADSFRVWQGEVQTGARVGPRAIGPSIDLSVRVYGRSGPFPASTGEEAERLVDSLKAAGMVYLKYHGHGNPDLYFGFARGARKAGIPLIGHVPRGVSEVEIADSGQRSVEHISSNNRCWPVVARGSDSAAIAERCGEAAKAYIRNGTWLTPTLAIVHYMKRPMEPAARFVKTMRDLGVTKFLAGTDVGPTYWKTYNIAPGVSLLQELTFLVDAGLTPLEALQSATLHPAQFFEIADSIGTVAPNQLADLVLLDGNPLADIYNVTRTHAVIANGRYYDRAALDAIDPDGIQRIRAFAAERSPSVKAASTDP